MNEKTAQVTVTYLITITREELNLPEDCSEEEFEKAVDEYLADMDMNDYCCNDVETEFYGFN